MVTVTQTRVSIGSQLKAALDDLVAKKAIDEWAYATSGYYLSGPRVYFPIFTPGELMDWLNERGYDIRFGKDPR